MYLYHRYLIRNYLSHFFAILVIVTSLIWLIQSLRFMHLIVNSGIPFREFITLTMLSLPPVIVLIAPIISYIATIYYFIKIFHTHELHALVFAGVSNDNIAKPLIVLKLFIVIFLFYFSFILIPHANKQFDKNINFYKNHYVSMLLQEGVFIHPVQDVTLYFKKKFSVDKLEGIFINDARNHGRDSTTMASQGELELGDDSIIFHLLDGVHQEFSAKGEYNVIQFDKLDYNVKIKSEFKVSHEKPIGQMTISELLFSDEMNKNKQAKMRSEGNFRIMWPILNILSSILALNAILSFQYSKKVTKKDIFYNIMLFLIFFMLFMLLKNLSIEMISIIFVQHTVIIVILGYYIKKIFFPESIIKSMH